MSLPASASDWEESVRAVGRRTTGGPKAKSTKKAKARINIREFFKPVLLTELPTVQIVISRW
jgi:hypothetical protein